MNQSSLGCKLSKIVKLKRAWVDDRLDVLGITRTHWQVMLWLSVLGRCTQSELLLECDMDAGQLARALHFFEKQKAIRRVTDEQDRRRLVIEVTALGRKKYLNSIEQAIEQENQLIASVLTNQDISLLDGMLSKIIMAFQENKS